MFKIVFRTILLSCFLISMAFGQQWQSYTNLNPIRQILIDGQLLWAATEGGVFGFSAADTQTLYKFTNIDGLPSTNITCLARDSHGRLYFGTAGSGLAVLDSNRARFDLITSRDQNLISDSINAVLCHGNYVFLGSPGGISFFDGDRWRTFSNRIYPLGSNIRALALGRDTLWMGHDNGVTAAPLYSILNPDPGPWVMWADIGSILNDVNYIYIADTTVYLCFNDGISRRIFGIWFRLPGSGPYNVDVTGLAIRRDTFYLSTKAGFFKYTEAGGRIDISSGLPSLDVRALSVASDSTLWAGTADGLARWDGSSWHPYRLNCILSNRVNRAVAGADGSIWLAHYHPFASRIRPDGAIVTYQNPTPNIPVTSLATDGFGNAWYGMAWWDNSGKSYLIRISPDDSITVIASPPLPPRCGLWDAYLGDDGLLYFAAYSHVATNYIVVLSSNGNLADLIYDPGLSSYMNPLSVARDQSGAVWIGSYSNNLARYYPASQSWRYFGTEAGLSSTRIYDIAIEPAGFIWLASAEGLNRCRYDESISAMSDVAVYRSANSPILGDEIRAVAIDRSGNKWIATNKGLNLLTWDNRWASYTASGQGSRLLSDDVQYVSVKPRDVTGDDILISTSKGLSVYHYYRDQAERMAAASVAPNPLRAGQDRTLLFCNLPNDAAISLYSIDGRLLASWAGPRAPAHMLTIDIAKDLGSKLSSGLYLCHIRPRSGQSQIIKLVVLR